MCRDPKNALAELFPASSVEAGASSLCLEVWKAPALQPWTCRQHSGLSACFKPTRRSETCCWRRESSWTVRTALASASLPTPGAFRTSSLFGAEQGEVCRICAPAAPSLLMPAVSTGLRRELDFASVHALLHEAAAEPHVRFQLA